ncbi:hypothetical protein E3N88_23187 [Mikania micrantha]|uniref:Uncharacterized protein n=1 Tax=Mikania micrantha TaxID=192012 RepID=A0A5N6NCK1_9ASTR|nr:hypothetical protein E3N88_23187 [Mikania micrantha]
MTSWERSDRWNSLHYGERRLQLVRNRRLFACSLTEKKPIRRSTATLDRERVEVAKSGIGCTNSTDRRPSRCLWGRTDRLISSCDRRSTLANATREEAAKIPSLTNAPA